MKKNPLFKIHIFANLVEKEVERKLLRDVGLSYSQCMILDFINNHPEISQRDVAVERHITPAAVSRHLEVLEELGFIKRKDREENKREHILIITNQGQSVATNAEKLLEQSMNSLIEDISRDELEDIDEIFNRLLGRFG
jgi:DNA-binding MarR family transcriptional regulator